MKKIISALILLSLLVISTPCFAQRAITVRGYTKSNGTYVKSHPSVSCPFRKTRKI